MFRDYIEGIFHKPSFEPLQKLRLHDIDAVTFAEARGGKGEDIEVDRDFTPVFGDDGCSHTRCHFRQKIGHLCTEKSTVDILCFITQNINNIIQCRVVSNS